MGEKLRLVVTLEMWERLRDNVEAADYCYLCDRHPGERHRGHDPECPLYRLQASAGGEP